MSRPGAGAPSAPARQIARPDEWRPVSARVLSADTRAPQVPGRHPVGVLSPLGAVQFLIGCILVGTTTTVYSISFAAIIYNGDLSEFLNRGIGLTLIGATVMAAGSGVLYSLRGVVSHPQDVTAVMLAVSAANIAANTRNPHPDAMFITTVVLVAMAGTIAGLCSIAISYCRLSRILMLIPHSIMGGFLAATGYLLVMGAIGMLMGRSITIWNVGELWVLKDMTTWLPWIAIGAVYVVMSRSIPADHVLPLAVAATLIGYYVLIASTGMSLAEARQAGMLLGPFPEDGMLQSIDTSVWKLIDWTLLARELPTVFAVAGMAILGGLLNLNGLRHLTGRSVDLDRDLRTTGILNGLSAMSGGLLGYPAISTTLLGWRLGLQGLAAGVSAALVCVLAALYGAEILGALPKGIFAAIIAFLGLELLYVWLWRRSRTLPGQDIVVICLVVVGAATIGFLEALALGFAGLAVMKLFRAAIRA